jgi:hypothetical protein
MQSVFILLIMILLSEFSHWCNQVIRPDILNTRNKSIVKQIGRAIERTQEFTEMGIVLLAPLGDRVIFFSLSEKKDNNLLY